MKTLRLLPLLILPLLGSETPVLPPGGVSLWNGRDLAGWKLFLNDATVSPAGVWSATDGVLRLDVSPT